MLQLARKSDKLRVRTFHGGGKSFSLICEQTQIVVPKSLQKQMSECYHEVLGHPGETRTELTIKQHFTWKTLCKTVQQVCSRCDACQCTKRNKKKYGHLPPKQAERIPWETLCVDIIVPYTIKRKKSTLCLWALTMIDPATGLFEMKEIEIKRADYIANYLEQTWFNRYPWPQTIICDRGTEIFAEVQPMIEANCGIKIRRITKRNPTANAIVERAHQTIENIIRNFSIANNDDIDDDDLWSGILGAVAFSLRAIVHTTSKAMPMQLVFVSRCHSQHPACSELNFIRGRKQSLIRKDNRKRIPYEYKVKGLSYGKRRT